MTPAIQLLKKHQVPHTVHQYEHDRETSSYGLEAAEKLGIDPSFVYKTLVVDQSTGSRPELAVAILPVASQLSLKAMATACKAKRVVMAKPEQVTRTTGYVLGGVSPLGQKRRLPTVIDHSAGELPTIYVSAGKRGLEIELAPDELGKLLESQLYPITA